MKIERENFVVLPFFVVAQGLEPAYISLFNIVLIKSLKCSIFQK